MDKGVRPMELVQFGRKNFSIIILDKDFRILGETLFPDNTYNPTIMLVVPKGYTFPTAITWIPSLTTIFLVSGNLSWRKNKRQLEQHMQ